MKTRRRKFRAAAHQQLPVSFLFAEEDMLQLLKLYYADGGRGWLSQLERQDMQAELPHRSRAVFDKSGLRGGNALLRQFSHQQMDWAIRQLRDFESVRAGKRIQGWLEYCLKVMIEKENPQAEDNTLMPPVRKQDKIRALLALGELLGQLTGHIDKPQETIRREIKLDSLMEKLANFKGQTETEDASPEDFTNHSQT